MADGTEQAEKSFIAETVELLEKIESGARGEFPEGDVPPTDELPTQEEQVEVEQEVVEEEQETTKEEGEPEVPEEPEPTDEVEPEEAESDAPLYEIPDEGEFEIEVEKGKFKTYKGDAVKNMIRRGRQYDVHKAELDTDRTKFTAEVETVRNEAAAQARQDMTARLLEAGAIVTQADGQYAWNPALTAQQQETIKAEVGEQETVAADAAGSQLTAPRFDRDALGEDADLYPPQVFDFMDQLSDAYDKLASSQNGRLTSVEEATRARIQAEEQMRVESFRFDIDASLKSHQLFKNGGRLYQAAFAEVVNAYQTGAHTGEVGPLAEQIHSAFAQELDVKIEPAGEPSETPAAPLQGKGSSPPQRKRMAPPAVGGSGRRPGMKPDDRKQKSGPELGTRESAKDILAALQRHSG